MARINLTYPRTPVGGVYIPGAKSIEGATGDIARTTVGWIESEKFHWVLYVGATAVSTEFDTAVTRTGLKTIKLSSTDITGRGNVSDSSDGSLAQLKLHSSRIKPSTSYTFNCYVKTTTVATNSVYCTVLQRDVAAGTLTTITSNKLTGTNDWTLLTATFTSDATAYYARIQLILNVTGNISDAYFDVNSMTLTEVLPRIAPTYPRTPIGGVYIPGAKSIEGATGDVAITASGWIESEKFKWYLSRSTTAVSAEFDTAVTRTGLKTLKLSTTDITGTCFCVVDEFTASVVTLAKYAWKIKGSTAYTFNCYAKTNNTAVNSARIQLVEYNIAGSALVNNYTAVLNGTNDWTLLTVSFTSAAASKYIYPYIKLNVAGNISDAWFDCSSMTLTEVLPRNPVV